MLITYVAYFLYLDNENKTMITLWGEVATRFDGQAVRHLGLEKSIITIFIGTIGYFQDGYHPGTSPQINDYSSIVIWTEYKEPPLVFIVYEELTFCKITIDQEGGEIYHFQD
jgi:hypothetical protein